MPGAITPLGKAARYWHTLRHLRREQIYGRVRMKLPRPRPDLSPAPPVRPGAALTPVAGRDPSLVGPGRFRFLNVEGDLAEIGWDGPQRPLLWRYNQHYFDDLISYGATEREDEHRALMLDWVRRNPPGEGAGWDPYPISLRIVNWTKWALLDPGRSLPPEGQASLAVQARWLLGRLETHLLGSHLLVNAKALFHAGLFFDGPEAAAWRRVALRILRREVPEQILPDGGHFDRTPMYTAIVLEDVLDLVNISAARAGALDEAEAAEAARWRRCAPAMIRWLRAMTHPDGGMARLNDTADEIAPALAELEAYAVRLGLDLPPPPGPVTWLSETGYARLEAGRAVLIVDMAPVGPDYLPGHAHADTLSFELSLDGRRVFVNSGTSEYGSGPERQRQRSTAAHNTVTVAGENSSDVWAGFRVGRRARPVAASVAQDGERIVAEGAHDGYAHLPGRPVHRRRFELRPDGLDIADETGAPALPAEARFQLFPGTALELDPDGRSARGLGPDGACCFQLSLQGGPARIEQSSWHPEFGVSVPTTCLVLPLADGRARFSMRWS